MHGNRGMGHVGRKSGFLDSQVRLILMSLVWRTCTTWQQDTWWPAPCMIFIALRNNTSSPVTTVMEHRASSLAVNTLTSARERVVLRREANWLSMTSMRANRINTRFLWLMIPRCLLICWHCLWWWEPDSDSHGCQPWCWIWTSMKPKDEFWGHARCKRRAMGWWNK